MFLDSLLDFFSGLFRSRCKDLPILKAPRFLRGPGCWIQKNSMDNPHIRDEVWQWYVTDSSNILDVLGMKLNGKLFMSFSGRYADRFCELLEMYGHMLCGVIWDYEFGADREQAKQDHKKVYASAKKHALIYGIVTQSDSEDSVRVNGVHYKDAQSYCDFLMPMLYCQWWDCEADRTMEVLCEARNATRLPVVPLIALEVTSDSDKIKKKKLLACELEDNYRGREMTGFGVWNVKSLNEEYLRVLKGVIA